MILHKIISALKPFITSYDFIKKIYRRKPNLTNQCSNDEFRIAQNISFSLNELL